MKKKNLKKLIPLERSEYRREVLPLFGILMAANFLFAYFFEFLHESYFMLGSLLLLNFGIICKTGYLTWRRLLYVTGGKYRVAKTSFLLILAELFPLYHLYLLTICMSNQSKKSLTASSLTFKPLGVYSIALVIIFAISFPRAPKTLPIFLDPTLSYVSHITLDSYRVFKAKDELEEKCLQSDDYLCFQKTSYKDIFPGTNTAVILAVASDALILFKRKERLEKENKELKKNKKHSYEAASALLSSNSFFLAENNCHKRITPMNLSGPIPMVTGLQTGYILQIVDTMLSKKFARVARERLTSMANQTMKHAPSEEASRSIASIKEEIIHNASYTCAPRFK